jgi:hypothetical protein
VGSVLFLYDFEFVPYENPPHTIDRFSRALRAYFEDRGLEYGMSALGGMVHCRGHVFSDRRPVTEDDRRGLAEWAGGQRVRCTARLGALEEDHGGIELFREVTEWVFVIDNRTAEDRAEAAAYREREARWVRSVRQRCVERGDAADPPLAGR